MIERKRATGGSLTRGEGRQYSRGSARQTIVVNAAGAPAGKGGLDKALHLVRQGPENTGLETMQSSITEFDVDNIEELRNIRDSLVNQVEVFTVKETPPDTYLRLGSGKVSLGEEYRSPGKCKLRILEAGTPKSSYTECKTTKARNSLTKRAQTKGDFTSYLMSERRKGGPSPLKRQLTVQDPRSHEEVSPEAPAVLKSFDYYKNNSTLSTPAKGNPGSATYIA